MRNGAGRRPSERERTSPTIAVASAPAGDTELRNYGIIGGSLDALRDLVRARQAAVIDQRKARQRLKGFLLRLGFRYSGKSSWNDAHQRYLARLTMPRPEQQIV